MCLSPHPRLQTHTHTQTCSGYNLCTWTCIAHLTNWGKNVSLHFTLLVGFMLKVIFNVIWVFMMHVYPSMCSKYVWTTPFNDIFNWVSMVDDIINSKYNIYNIQMWKNAYWITVSIWTFLVTLAKWKGAKKHYLLYLPTCISNYCQWFTVNITTKSNSN